MRILLRPFSILYSVITTLRNRLFDSGILPSEVFPVPVINVGNLVAGGSGKSPHVLMLINLLKKDYKVAVLSRGYGRKTKGYRLVTKNETAETCGDEPLQYIHYHPEIKVAVCENRRKGIERLLEDAYQPEVILLDDAYQHRYVKAGMNILLTEYDKPFTDDHLLPEGMLRESRSGAKRADHVIITKSPFPLPESTEVIRKKLKRYSDAPIGFTYMRYREPVPILHKTQKSYAGSSSVLLVTGIARPRPLITYLSHQGKNLQHVGFKDHHDFTETDAERIRKEFFELIKSDTSGIIITTRKDAMRLSTPALLPLLNELPLFVIDIEATFALGEAEFKNAVLDYVRTFE